MDREIAVAAVAASAPRVKGNTYAAHHTARFVLAARMPLLFPAHQVGSNGQFFAINILARLGDVEILAEELDRVHVQLGGEIVERTHGKNGSLRMVRSAPGPRRTDVVADRSVLLALIRDCEDVGHRRHASASRTSRAPGFRLPSDDGSVFFCPNLHTGIGGGSSTSDLEFSVALQHHTNRLAVGLLRNFGGINSPTIGREFAAEAAANVILMDVNVGSWNFQRFGHLAGNAGNILRGDVSKKMILIGPIGNRTVTFQAAVE